MGQFDQLAAQLTAALDGLEKAALPLAQAKARIAQDAAELAALRDERNRLLARIAELEAEAQTLSGVTDEVEARLDDAITEIRAALAR